MSENSTDELADALWRVLVNDPALVRHLSPSQMPTQSGPATLGERHESRPKRLGLRPATS